MTSTKSGVSAKTLHRLLGFGSYQTSWTMLHNFRKAMVRQGRERLAGDVEVDEAMLGGSRPGKPGRGALGKQLVGIAVEQTPADGFGRCRLSVIANAEAETLRSFLWDNVEPGARVLTDGLGSYRWAVGSDYVLAATPVRGSGKKPHDLLPGVHRVTSLVKRWLLGTHQGAVRREHMQAYLDEFTFRFNRRRSNARGLLFYRLLQQAALTERVTYRALVAVPKPRKRGSSEPKPPAARHSAPPSLRMQVAPRPWR
jgi:transposase-like protein